MGAGMKICVESDENSTGCLVRATALGPGLFGGVRIGRWGHTPQNTFNLLSNDFDMY